MDFQPGWHDRGVCERGRRAEAVGGNSLRCREGEVEEGPAPSWKPVPGCQPTSGQAQLLRCCAGRGSRDGDMQGQS